MLDQRQLLFKLGLFFNLSEQIDETAIMAKTNFLLIMSSGQRQYRKEHFKEMIYCRSPC